MPTPYKVLSRPSEITPPPAPEGSGSIPASGSGIASHTPGPWSVLYTTLDRAIVRWHIAGKKHGSAYPICEHVMEDEPGGEEQLANASLIAAAPELLQELQNIANAKPSTWDDPGDFKAWAQSRARHAIAKALGQNTEAQPGATP